MTQSIALLDWENHVLYVPPFCDQVSDLPRQAIRFKAFVAAQSLSSRSAGTYAHPDAEIVEYKTARFVCTAMREPLVWNGERRYRVC